MNKKLILSLMFVVLMFISCTETVNYEGVESAGKFMGAEDNNIDGIDLIKSIKKVYSMNNISTNILAASIRNVPHVGQAFEVGADIVTLPPSIFEEMYKHDLTDQGIKQFDKDWKKLNS